MANCIIIGAGLGGLYTALRLVNSGVNPKHMIIIDPRSGRYTRPGHLHPSLFISVIKKTRMSNPTQPSDALHIKELERLMYYYAIIEMSVHFTREHFIGLQEKTEKQPTAVITLKADGSQGVYPADFVFDCTGTNGLVAEAINTNLQAQGLEPYFKSSSLVDINPVTDHLIAQVIIPNSQALPNSFKMMDYLLYTRDFTDASIVNFIRQLRQFGWMYPTLPIFYTYAQNDSEKVVLYMETPANLAKEKQGAWIRLLLSLYSGNEVTDYKELNPSVKYHEKPRIIGFKNLPHVLNRVIYNSDKLPMIIMGFDALKGFDYRLASGVKGGIKCFEMMLEQMKISEGIIQTIDSIAVEEKVLKYINNTYRNKVNNFTKHRQVLLFLDCAQFSDSYFAVAKSLGSNEAVKKQKYQTIAASFAYEGAMGFYSIAGALEDPLKYLLLIMELLLRAKEFTVHSEERIHQDINAALEKMSLDLHAEFSAKKVGELSETTLSELRSLYADLKNRFAKLNAREQELVDVQPDKSCLSLSLLFHWMNKTQPIPRPLSFFNPTMKALRLGLIFSSLVLLMGVFCGVLKPAEDMDMTDNPGFSF